MPERQETDRSAEDARRRESVARYSGFRPEIQGLRAVAVIMVVLYHVFLGRVSGGVDIFLLISAFFMTLSFVRKLEGGRPLRIGRYWLHTFKRLLPLAVLTVLGTLVLVALFFPAYRVEEALRQAAATLTYTENWALALTSVDYYAADRSTASPFQHFWSLSVQGQVFLLWPLLFGLTWLLTRGRSRLRPVPVLAVLFSAIFAASLVFSIVTTATQQEFAYFDTRTRLWEFALGSLLALALPFIRLPRWLRVVLGWVGFVSMVLVGLLVDVQGAFPGWIALWPLLSAAAIMVAGQTNSRFGLDRIFAAKPLVRLGDSSYALYLVHWPLLITYLVIRDRPEAGPRSGVVLIVLSLALAILATKLIETPLKSWKWPEATKLRLAGAVVVCLAVGLGPVLAWQQSLRADVAEAPDGPTASNPGALVLRDDVQTAPDPDAPTIPLAAQLDDQAPDRGAACPSEWDIPVGSQQWCRESVPAEDPSQTVLLIGNSHSEHWLDALRPVAEANGWRVVSYIRPGCYWTSHEDQRDDECGPWLDGSMPLVHQIDPDLIITQSTFTNAGGEYYKPDFDQRVREVTGEGYRVLGVRDIPRFDQAPPECVMEEGSAQAPQCQKTHPMLGQPDPMQPLAEELPLYAEMDMTDQICPEGTCPPVIGNMYVQWDSGHLSIPYSRSLAWTFGDRLSAALAEDGVVVEHQPALPQLQ